MSELFNEIFQKSKHVHAVDFDRLMVQFDNFLLLLEIEAIDGDKDYLFDVFDNRELRMSVDINNDIDYLNRLKITKILITDYEYLGYREDIDDDYPPRSICYKLYVILYHLNNINPSFVKRYSLDLNDGYDNAGGFCPAEPNYIFLIEINRHQFNIDSLSTLDQKNISTFVPQKFYWDFIKRYDKIFDSKKIRILQTNTKVRRIIYLKALTDYLIENPKVPNNKINKRFEEYLTKLELNEFLISKNLKGIIRKTKTGSSAKPYIELAKELGLLNPINRILVSGKRLKVYQVLKTQLKENSNTYEISELDKLFFLEILLERDFFYLFVLFEIVYINKTISYNNLSKVYRPLLINRLNEFLDQNKFERNYKIQKDIRKIKERIDSWEKSKKYLEHVLMPRINWLRDFELFDLNKNNIVSITEKGVTFFSHLCVWNDINYERVISPNNFLNRFYTHSFANTYYSNTSINDEKDDSALFDKINLYLKESFDFFQTLAPNRVTSSQAITYCVYKLYIEDRVTVGKKFIENFLSSDQQNLFIYKYQDQYSDGYIQLN